MLEISPQTAVHKCSEDEHQWCLRVWARAPPDRPAAQGAEQDAQQAREKEPGCHTTYLGGQKAVPEEAEIRPSRKGVVVSHCGTQHAQFPAFAQDILSPR